MTHQCDEPVTQMHLKPAMTVGELVNAMGKAGAYNGGSLYHAAEIYEQMLKDKDTTKFFGLAGAMVAGRHGRDRFRSYQGRPHRHPRLDRCKPHARYHRGNRLPALPRHRILQRHRLRHDEINRIYDVYLPNEAFEHFETFMQSVYGELEPGTTVSISGLLRHIGLHLKTGILATAAQKAIPVYCPAIQDSMVGLQVLALLADEQGDRGRICRYAGAP